MAAAQPAAAAQDARAWDAEDVLPERPLYLLISALGAKETTAGNPASQAIFSEFLRTLESHGFYSEEDVTAPTVYRTTIEAIMDEVRRKLLHIDLIDADEHHQKNDGSVKVRRNEGGF